MGWPIERTSWIGSFYGASSRDFKAWVCVGEQQVLSPHMWLPWLSCLLLRLRLFYSFSSTSGLLCGDVHRNALINALGLFVLSGGKRVTSSLLRYFCGLYSTHSLNSLSQLVYNHSFTILHESVPVLKQRS